MSLIFCLFWCGLWGGLSAQFRSFTSLVGIGEPNQDFSYYSAMRSDSSNGPTIETNSVVQKLDHFNPSDKRTWSQRYRYNAQHYAPGGPVFLMVGGEEEMSSMWLASGAMMEYAAQLNAFCFQLEHRYYGMSQPTENLNNTNIVYLSIKQALADVEEFILFSIRNNNQFNFENNAKWVLFGGSYPGSLAAWARMTYPHLVHAAVSSSSVIKTLIDNKEYLKVAKNVLSAYNPKCVTNIRQATEMISDLLKTENGTRYIEKKFRTCHKINTNVKKYRAQFYQQLALPISSIIQYNQDNRYNRDMRTLSVTSLCDMMLNKSSGNPLDRYIAVHKKLRLLSNRACSSYSYGKTLAFNSETVWNKGSVKSGDRQWYYQLCTEIGNFVTSNKNHHLFGDHIPLDFFTQLCTDVFGDAFDFSALKMAVKQTTMKYQNLRRKTSRVIYVHGSYDPWNGLGLTEPKSDDSVSIVIEGVSHCADVYPTLESDPPQLTEARETIVYNLKKWLS